MNTAQWLAPNDEIKGTGGAAVTTWSVGDLLLIDGQRYDCVATVPYWSQRQGAEIRLATFSSLCPDCAGSFEVSVKAIHPRPLSRIRSRLLRRCPFCRAGGRRLNKVLHVPARRDADAETLEPGSMNVTKG